MARAPIDRLPDDLLASGEHWLAVQTLTVRGPKAMAAWAAERDLGAALPNRSRTHPGASGTATIGVAVPRTFLAAISDRHLALFGVKFGGRVGELVGSWPLPSTSLDVFDDGDRVRSRLFVFGVDDGALVAGTAGINGKAIEGADHFVETFRSSAARIAG